MIRKSVKESRGLFNHFGTTILFHRILLHWIIFRFFFNFMHRPKGILPTGHSEWNVDIIVRLFELVHLSSIYYWSEFEQ